MQTEAVETRQLIEQYFQELGGRQKTEALIEKYVSAPELKAVILETDEGFPGYSFEVHDLVVEGDMAAVRATVHGAHHGDYAGVAPTGRKIAVAAMVFYKVVDSRIANFWMQVDMPSLMKQITA